MDSFALAYVPSNDKNDENNANKEHFSVKVNINLWTQCGWDDETPVLDIGLMLSHLSDAKKIRLYLPFQVEKEDLEDLCECLCVTEKTADKEDSHYAKTQRKQE